MSEPKILERRVYGFKGFSKNLVCEPNKFTSKTYKPGHRYHIKPPINICLRGFHFGTWPIDIFDFYNPACNSRYFKVSGSGHYDDKINQYSSDSKIAVENLYISNQELSWKQMIEAARDIADNRNYPKILQHRIDKIDKDDIMISSKPYQGVIIDKEYTIGIAKTDRSYVQLDKFGSTGITNGFDSFIESCSRRTVSCAMNAGSTSVIYSNESIAITNDFISTIINDGSNNITITKAKDSYSFLTDKSESSVDIINSQSVAKSLGDNNIIIDMGLIDDNPIDDESIIDLHGKNNIAISYHLCNFFRAAQKNSIIILVDKRTKTSRIIQVDGKKIKLNTWYRLAFSETNQIDKIDWKEATSAELAYINITMREE